MRWRRRDCAWIAAAAVDRSMSYSAALLVLVLVGGFFGGGGGGIGLLAPLSRWLGPGGPCPGPRRESGLARDGGFSALERGCETSRLERLRGIFFLGPAVADGIGGGGAGRGGGGPGWSGIEGNFSNVNPSNGTGGTGGGGCAPLSLGADRATRRCTRLRTFRSVSMGFLERDLWPIDSESESDSHTDCSGYAASERLVMGRRGRAG